MRLTIGQISELLSFFYSILHRFIRSAALMLNTAHTITDHGIKAIDF